MSRNWKNFKDISRKLLEIPPLLKLKEFPNAVFAEHVRKIHHKMQNAAKTQILKWFMGFIFSNHKRKFKIINKKKINFKSVALFL